MTATLFRELRDTVASGGGTFTLERPQTQGGITFATYSATYWVSGDISDEQLTGVARAIYGDFEFGWETWQGSIPLGKGKQSSFSIEDFPSDYIGFVAYVRGTSTRAILEELGPIRGARESEVPHSECLGSTCDRFDVKNWDFQGLTPKVQIDGRWVNQPWPEDLQISPINDPGLWQFQGDNTCWGSLCVDMTGFFYDAPWE